MLQISRRIEYALRASIHLASVPDSASVPFREIGAAQGIPKDFLAKILKSLVDAGIVRSTRGSQGGFTLARPAEVTFLDVIQAVEGPVALNLCSEHGGGCAWSAGCGMAGIWRSAEGAMLDVFRATTLASVSVPERAA